jgi:hypothetical protein
MRRLLSASGALALVLGVCGPVASEPPADPVPGAQEDKIHESDKLNYRLTIRPTWEWKSPDGKDVVEAAERALDQVRERQPDGKFAMVDANGRGGRLVLAISDPPKSLDKGYEESMRLWQMADMEIRRLQAAAPSEATQKRIEEENANAVKHMEAVEKGLQALAVDKDVVKLLMQRFGSDAGKWPETSADTMEMSGPTERDAAVPAIRVKAEGEAGNLKGVPMPCIAQMWVFVVKGKMYRLATWGWPSSQRDPERIKGEIDYAQLEYRIPKSAAMMAKPDPEAPDPTAPVEPPSDVGEEKAVDNKLFSGWEVTKPKGFKTIEIDRTKPDAPEFKFEAGSGRDPRVTVYLDVQRSDEKGATGQAKGEMDIRRLYVNAWVQFLSLHSQGALEVFEWERPSSDRPYFSLPDLEKRTPVKRPPPGVKKEWDWAEIEKLGVVSEADGIRFGEVKGRNTYRWGAKGERERAGTEFLLRYAFHSGVRTYVITVSAYGDSLLKFKNETDALLKSFKVHPIK